MVKTRVKLGKYEAWIVVENQEIEHYEVEVNEESKVATCWIASTAGKHFGVRIEKHHHDFDCRAIISLDGCQQLETTLRAESRLGLLNNVYIGNGTTRPFTFGILSLTDDESCLTSSSYEELGNIQVTICHITNYKILGEHSGGHRIQEIDKIHENAKKALSHRVSFGQAQKGKPWKRVSYDTHETVATFIFRYRPLDLLKANKIAPCDPPSAETEAAVVRSASKSVSAIGNSASRKRKAVLKEEAEERNDTIDSEDEDDRKREAELEAELEKVRQSRLNRNQGKHKHKKVKREKSSFVAGEIIDLTI